MTEISHIPQFRALVIEDHDFQRDIVTQVLKRCGAATVSEATNGITAIAAIEAAHESFDILVCDLNMPDMDGLEFLRYLGERRYTNSVILASSLDASIIRSADVMGRTYGVRLLGAVEKPITRIKLLPLLLRHFGPQLTPLRPQVQPMSLAEIKKGLEQRQFVPFFQPKVDMRRCTLAGVEALMRWRHPERGIIAPAAFIPVMEENDLITQITYDIFELALAACRQWFNRSHLVPVAVNVSMESLTDTTLPDQFSSRVDAANLDPSLVTIEITESTAIPDLGHSLETLARLRMKGFGLSIDDYGTGFSSMQQLTRIPFSELKIDQTFVTGSAHEPVLSALLESSVDIGRRLGLKTVAEGVESNEDWEVTARLECDIAQGYFIAKPMPPTELLDWYKTWLGRCGQNPPSGTIANTRAV